MPVFSEVFTSSQQSSTVVAAGTSVAAYLPRFHGSNTNSSMGVPGRSREHSVQVIASYQSPEIIRAFPITLWSLASGFLNDVLRPA